MCDIQWPDWLNHPGLCHLLRRQYFETTLSTHLASTQALLSTWRMPQDVIDAALIAAIFDVVDDWEIPSGVRSMIGGKAEFLARRSSLLSKKVLFSLATDSEFSAKSLLEDVSGDADLCHILTARSFTIAGSSNLIPASNLNDLVQQLGGNLDEVPYEYYLASHLNGVATESDCEIALRHFAHRLSVQRIEQLPFPHVVVVEVFPRRFLNQLELALPSDDIYAETSNASDYAATCREVLGIEGSRRHVWLTALSRTRKDERCFKEDLKREFWSRFRRALSSSEFGTALVRLVLPSSEKQHFRVATRLVLETGCAFLPPHVDSNGKIITVIMYLAGTGCHEEMPGTALYEQLNSVGTVLRKRISFARNTAFVLPSPDKRLHGVEPTILRAPRRSLHFYVQWQDAEERRQLA